MAAPPSWEGPLRLSFVTCPVAPWPATTEAETVRFNLIVGLRMMGCAASSAFESWCCRR